MKLVDRNVREVTDEEWDWAELVIISGMIVQKDDMAVQISKAKQWSACRWPLRELHTGCTGTGSGGFQDP